MSSLTSLFSSYFFAQPILDDKSGLGFKLTPIPQPPTLPLLGNATQMDKTLPHERTFRRFWKEYGEIYQLSIPGRQIIVINSHRLVKEALDEKRFHKYLSVGLVEIRPLVGDGLFTAYHGEANWAPAHRILTPAFSPGSIKGMFDDMFDVCSQLALKWERFGPDHPINATEDFTRLAFDTVALCTMHYRVNSFYNEERHPFVSSMASYFAEAQKRVRIPGFLKGVISSAQWEADKKAMDDIVNKVITDRRESGISHGDLLDLMLSGKDPQTGETLSDENIRYQLLTFMIAGHETTAGLLSFAMFELLRNPHAYAKVREEIDTVLQGKHIRPEHLSKFPYIVAVMRESLRLYPLATMITLTPYEDTTLGGEYLLSKGSTIGVGIAWLQRDKAIWGDDAEDFKPERMLDGKFEALPPKAWIPFGSGARACIGRAFAWQEAIIAIVTMFQRFDFSFVDPSYQLKFKQALTIKPDELFIHAKPKDGILPMVAGGNTPKQASPSIQPKTELPNDANNDLNVKLSVLYGGNTGTCEAFAQRIASTATSKGFRATVLPLDDASTSLSTTGPTIIIAASFEGEPADNARRFVERVQQLEREDELSGVEYAVFGCGNRDWATTFQRIPRLIDEILERHGAKRLSPRGEGDAAGAEFFDSFDIWETGLWESLEKKYRLRASSDSKTSIFDIRVISNGTQRAQGLRHQDVTLARITENRLLTSSAKAEKRHLEFELPEGISYNAGDYLAVVPTNPPAYVKHALAHFGLSEETIVEICCNSPTPLPTDHPVELRRILEGYVELAQPATKRNLETLLEAAQDETKISLQRMIDNYKEMIVDRRVSVLDILYTHPSLQVSMSDFLGMLPSMKVRQYSISSSPLYNPRSATLTVSVLNAPSMSGSTLPFLGVASNYLSNLHEGEPVQVMVRPSATTFSLPSDVSIPLVLFCAGSGLAPMRGFIQERVIQSQSGRTNVGKILLFFGCRHPEQDYLYAESDLKEWVKMGAVDVRPAFSRAMDQSEGCHYVQDRAIKDGEEVMELYRQNAKFFTCGGAAVAAGVREALVTLFERETGSREEGVEAFKALQKAERYATDIFT